jgi:heme/copper-type cytochrome/quinol oxidase subunit 1
VLGSLPAEFADWNLFISINAFLFFLSTFFLVANIIISLVRGQDAPPDPWGGWSFEWMTDSPPPTPSFPLDNLPVLRDANEHVANEPSKLGIWFNRLMVADEEVSN